MGNALSIAAVSRVLRQIVESKVTHYGLDGYIGSDVLVTAEPPQDDLERTRINLFLHRIVESAACRNNPLPTYDRNGNRIGRPVLALDLHYAVTAYADGDFHSELMLGCAMQALYETPTLGRSLILDILGQDDGANTLLDSRLGELIENIRVRPRNLNEDAFTRLLSAFHLPYRLTVFYEVSVVLIESDFPSQVAPPVLERPAPRAYGHTGAFGPTLTNASPQIATTGNTVTLQGLMLAGDEVRVEAFHRDASITIAPLAIAPADVSETAISFSPPATWPVGHYEVRVSMITSGSTVRRQTNRIALTLAPTVTLDSIDRADDPPNQVTITVNVVPSLRPGQQSVLVVGTTASPGPAVTAAAAELTFEDIDLPPGNAPMRLQVDGIESIWIDREATPPSILPGSIISVP